MHKDKDGNWSKVIKNEQMKQEFISANITPVLSCQKQIVFLGNAEAQQKLKLHDN